MDLYQAPRGTNDILPEDQSYWRYIEAKAAQIAMLYGYRRIDIPTFEDTRLFTRVGEGTDVVQKEMYSFDDRGGNSLTLRPEGTVSVCRAYLEHGLQNQPQPVKLFYFITTFRYDRPQAGRYREFHQFGCEAIGDMDPALDTEIIDLLWQFYCSLGIGQLHLKINSIGCQNCRPAYLVKLKEYYTDCLSDVCADCKIRLETNTLRLLDCKNERCRLIAVGAPKSYEQLCPECTVHFEQLKKYLTLLGLPYETDHCLVRGLDYYTRTVFEIQPELEGAQSTLVGGGRYDGLIEELGGKPTPGIGFGAGIERIILNLKRQGLPIPPIPNPLLFVAFLGDEAKEAAIKLSADLRKQEISLVMAPGNKSLKAQLRQANTLGVRYAAILGDEEIKTGTVQLRDMQTSLQENLPQGQLLEKLRKF
ncbi:MAG TPA: histidine--tRNA ligase [Dehalococcoidales bacterium]